MEEEKNENAGHVLPPHKTRTYLHTEHHHSHKCGPEQTSSVESRVSKVESNRLSEVLSDARESKRERVKGRGREYEGEGGRESVRKK